MVDPNAEPLKIVTLQAGQYLTKNYFFNSLVIHTQTGGTLVSMLQG
jgi:hypothetical protein